MAGYTITEEEAVTLTTEYRSNHTEQTRAFKIDKAEIDEIFAEHPTAMGVRAYLGQKPNAGALQMVMVATDAEGNDILDVFYDHTTPCPEECDTGSVLNNGN